MVDSRQRYHYFNSAVQPSEGAAIYGTLKHRFSKDILAQYVL